MLTGYILDGTDWRAVCYLGRGALTLGELYEHAEKIAAALAREGVDLEWIGW